MQYATAAEVVYAVGATVAVEEVEAGDERGVEVAQLANGAFVEVGCVVGCEWLDGFERCKEACIVVPAAYDLCDVGASG